MTNAKIPHEAKASPIAYVTGEYPRATDTFVQREVAALRDLGWTVETATIRATDPRHHVGEEQRAEHARTFAVQNAAKSPLTLLRAHGRMLARAPGRWFKAAGLAWRTKPPGLKNGLWQLFYFLEAGVLGRHLQDKGVTHVHNHFANSSCSVTMIMSQMTGISYSLTMHGPAIFFEPKHWRIDEKIARAEFVSCISHFCRAQAMYFSDPVQWHKLRILHCGVDPARYDQPRQGDFAKRLLFVGRLDAIKGVPLLLEALAQLEAHPDASLRVIGDGPARATLEARTAELGLTDRVSFLGYQNQDAVAEALSETDLFVLPSFAEGVPVVLMEALAARVPVIASRVAGVGELVEDGISGRTIPAGDLASLVAAVDEILSDPTRAAAMGQAGRDKVVAEFNTATEAAWLSELLTGARAGALPDGLRPV